MKICIQCNEHEAAPSRRVCYKCRGKYAKELNLRKFGVCGSRVKQMCEICSIEFLRCRKQQIICPKCRKESLNTGYNRNDYLFSNKPGVTNHRTIAESILGKKLNYNEIVHHIDENCKNNSLDNLLVLSRSNHGKLHCFLRLERIKWIKENSISDWTKEIWIKTQKWIDDNQVSAILLSDIQNGRVAKLAETQQT
jgi:HNH endonuclease